MKTKIILAACMPILLCFALNAQSLSENPYLQNSIDLKNKAQSAFDMGDYEQAKALAEQAQVNTDRSDALIQKLIAITEADRAITEAKDWQGWIDSINDMQEYQTDYDEAVSSLEAAVTSFDSEDYFTAKDQAFASTKLFVGIAGEYARRAIDEAALNLGSAQKQKLSAAQKALLQKVSGLIDLANQDYDNRDYRKAAENALAAMMAMRQDLASATKAAPGTLPEKYVVELNLARRDCLWRIAGFPFVYNNPWEWKKLYEANKNLLTDPGDPNLILPGQIITIPSLSGEVRTGTYDPAGSYGTYKK